MDRGAVVTDDGIVKSEDNKSCLQAKAGLQITEFEALQDNFQKDLEIASSSRALEDLDNIRVKYLGKKGLVSGLLSNIGKLPASERQSYGASVNAIKSQISLAIDNLKTDFEREALEAELKSERIDVTLPSRGLGVGFLHPLSKVISDIRQILERLGFTLTSGPEIEDDWHNFTALNIPDLHPARQMHDTFYISNTGDASASDSAVKEAESLKLLRTHTSNVQIRYMSTNKPPHQIYSIGKVYRSDYDATHTPMFHQAEGLLIDESITLGHLRWCLETFLQEFFEVSEAPIRFRPSYFPFTEPSYEVDVRCDRSKRGEIKIGTGNDWLEILGCGMVHSNVLRNVGVDTDKFQGFAFGIGVERLAMLKYGISDLRSFFHGDVRWLEHYGFNSI